MTNKRVFRLRATRSVAKSLNCVLRLGVLLSLLSASACQQRPVAVTATPPYIPDRGNLAVRCGALIDGLSDHVTHGRVLLIREGRIVHIGNRDAAIPADLPLLDLGAYTCLPGLINTHVHFDALAEDAVDYGVYYRRTRDDHRTLALEVAKTTLGTGFTTVRNVGAWFPDAIYHARERIRSGDAVGPRIRTAGPYLTIPGGGGDLTFPEIPTEKIPAESQSGIASTPEGFADRARDAIEQGADFLKVIASGAVFSVGADPGAPEMTEADIAAVVNVAHAAGVKVTAHVHSAQSARDAIRAGVDSIEHASLLDDEAIALAAENNVALSMDIYNGSYTDTVGRAQGYPEVFLQRNHDTTEAQRVVFEKALAAGITLLYGTDAAVLPHTMGGWQFAIMVERGMAPMEAIRSATSVPAQHMGLAQDVGALAPGRLGDLIAVRGDPLADMTVLRSVEVVIKGGLVFKNPH